METQQGATTSRQVCLSVCVHAIYVHVAVLRGRVSARDKDAPPSPSPAACLCASVCASVLSPRRGGADKRCPPCALVRLCVCCCWCCWSLWFIFVRVRLLLGLSDPRVYMYITFSGADSPRAVSRQTRPGYRSAAVRVPLPWRWRLLRYCSICGGCPRVAVVCVWMVGGGPRDFSCFFFLWCGRLPCWVRVASYW